MKKIPPITRQTELTFLFIRVCSNYVTTFKDSGVIGGAAFTVTETELVGTQRPFSKLYGGKWPFLYIIV